MITRRSFFTGLIAAPAVIKLPGLLMPVKPLDDVIISKPIVIWKETYKASRFKPMTAAEFRAIVEPILNQTFDGNYRTWRGV